MEERPRKTSAHCKRCPSDRENRINTLLCKKNYKNFIEINFVLNKEYCDIFNDGFSPDNIIKNISLRNPGLEFSEGDTLIFFDELQACPNCATSLKFFKQDGRYDVICSGSLMGINYKQIESNSVGYKEDYEMYSMDFEEFLWAKGYKQEQIDALYKHMLELKPFSETEMRVMLENFNEYMIIGGMPAIVNSFVTKKNYSGTLKMQNRYFSIMKKILQSTQPDSTKERYSIYIVRYPYFSVVKTKSSRYQR